MIRYVELKECLVGADFFRKDRVYVLPCPVPRIDKNLLYFLCFPYSGFGYRVRGNLIRPCFQDTFPTKEEVEMLVMLNYDLPDELLEFL